LINSRGYFDCVKLDSFSRKFFLISTATFSPDGKNIAFGVTDPERVVLLNIATGKQKEFVTNSDYESGINSNIAFSPDGSLIGRTRFLYNGTTDVASLYVWDVLSGNPVFMPAFSCSLKEINQSHTIPQTSFSPDGRFLVAGNSLFGVDPNQK
jgi:Tol biopolymer transport system component